MPNASFVILNRCAQSVEVELRAAAMLRSKLPHTARKWSLVATTYLADDPGGLVPLPDEHGVDEDPFVFPWRTGPLSPMVEAAELHADELDGHVLRLQAVSLTIATFSPAAIGLFQAPTALLPGGRWTWRRPLSQAARCAAAALRTDLRAIHPPKWCQTAPMHCSAAYVTLASGLIALCESQGESCHAGAPFSCHKAVRDKKRAVPPSSLAPECQDWCRAQDVTADTAKDKAQVATSQFQLPGFSLVDRLKSVCFALVSTIRRTLTTSVKNTEAERMDERRLRLSWEERCALSSLVCASCHECSERREKTDIELRMRTIIQNGVFRYAEARLHKIPKDELEVLQRSLAARLVKPPPGLLNHTKGALVASILELKRRLDLDARAASETKMVVGLRKDVDAGLSGYTGAKLSKMPTTHLDVLQRMVKETLHIDPPLTNRTKGALVASIMQMKLLLEMRDPS